MFAVVCGWLLPQVGRHVVSRNCDGRLALGRIGNLIEQLEGLVRCSHPPPQNIPTIFHVHVILSHSHA
jgi:hypothetical protein